MIRTGIAYVAFAAAVVLAAAQVTGGFDRLSAALGASFVLILIGFSAQRVLVDIIAGFSMFTEKWYSVGDTIAIPTMELQGVVEDVSLRRTKLRSLDGEIINIHNSQIPAVRVLPGGTKEFDVELVASNREAAELLVESVTSILPVGPTTFAQRPQVHQIDELAPALVRLRIRAAVAPGREWLVHGFYTDLLKERADKHLIVHGPVVLTVDEGADAELRARQRSDALGRRRLERRDRRQQPVDLVGGVVVDDPGADRAAVLEPEPLHHLHRVVVALPHRDSPRRRAAWPPRAVGNAVDVERERRDASVHRRQPVERDVLRQAGEEALAEGALVRLDRLPADRLDVLDRGDEARRAARAAACRSRSDGRAAGRPRAGPCTAATPRAAPRGRRRSPRCGPKNLYGEQMRTSTPHSATSIGPCGP